MVFSNQCNDNKLRNVGTLLTCKENNKKYIYSKYVSKRSDFAEAVGIKVVCYLFKHKYSYHQFIPNATIT